MSRPTLVRPAARALALLLFLLLLGPTVSCGTSPEPSAVPPAASATGPLPAPLPAPPAPPSLAGDAPAKAGPPRAFADPTREIPLEAGWNLIGVPLHAVTGADDLAAAMYRWGGQGYQSVDAVAQPAQVDTRYGYWAFSPVADTPVFAGSEVVPGSQQTVPLVPGWNMVCFVSPDEVALSGVMVSDGTTERPMATAATPQIANPGGAYLFATAFYYEGGAYRSVNLLDPAAKSVPRKGFWLYSFVAGSLRYEALAELADLQADIQSTGGGWTAAATEISGNPDRDQMLGAELVAEPDVQPRSSGPDPKPVPVSAQGLPDRFSWRDHQGTDWMGRVKNQGTFGSCTSHAVVGALEAYINIGNGPSTAPELSEWYLHHSGRGNEPGWAISTALQKLDTGGTVLEAWIPYKTFPAFDPTGADSGPWSARRYHLRGPFKHLEDAAEIKAFISTYNPVVASFEVFEDFYAYSGGVYRHVRGASEGFHAVILYGYDDAEGCWLARNSWGSRWGVGGDFKIKYGECRIEEDVHDIGYLSYPGQSDRTLVWTEQVPGQPSDYAQLRYSDSPLNPLETATTVVASQDAVEGNPYNPALSPDGSKVVYEQGPRRFTPEQHNSVRVADLPAGARASLKTGSTDDTAIRSYDVPDWSPDGTLVAWRKRTIDPVMFTSTQELWVRDLLTGEEFQVDAGGPGVSIGPPDFHRNSRRLAYWKSSPAPGFYETSLDVRDIIHPDTLFLVRREIRTVVTRKLRDGDGWEVRYSPIRVFHGNWRSWLAYKDSSTNTLNLMDQDGNHQQTLVSGTSVNHAFAWGGGGTIDPLGGGGGLTAVWGYASASIGMTFLTGNVTFPYTCGVGNGNCWSNTWSTASQRTILDLDYLRY